MTGVIPANEEFINSFTVSSNYIDATPDGYKLGLIVNPCQGKDPNCCDDTYGNGEYFVDDGDNTLSQSERVCAGKSVDCLFASNGEPIEEQNARMALFDLIVDETCAEEYVVFERAKISIMFSPQHAHFVVIQHSYSSFSFATKQLEYSII